MKFGVMSIYIDRYYTVIVQCSHSTVIVQCSGTGGNHFHEWVTFTCFLATKELIFRVLINPPLYSKLTCLNLELLKANLLFHPTCAFY